MKNLTPSYVAKEEAPQRKPVELYRIWRGDETPHCYTSGDVAVIYPGPTNDEYLSATIKRSLIRYDSQLEVTKCSIQAAFVEDPVLEFVAINPVEIYWVMIMKLHREQLPLEADVIFLGQIKSVSFKGIQADVECVGFEHFLKMPIPTERYQITCNWKVFDSKCNGVSVSSVNRGRAGNVATIETKIAHELVPGDWAVISGMGSAGYDGTWEVASIPDTMHFTYVNAEANEGETADTGGAIVRDMKIKYKVPVTVTLDPTKTILTAIIFGTYTAGYFIGGTVEFGVEKRTIVAHSVNTITMSYRMINLDLNNDDISDGDVDVYPGCDGRAATCRDKFDNIFNFFGHPYIPIENPAMRT